MDHCQKTRTLSGSYRWSTLSRWGLDRVDQVGGGGRVTDAHRTVGQHFADASLADDRFVKVEDGEKKCLDHDTRYSDPEEVPGQNYGIYADAGDQIVVLDVDVHRNDGQKETAVEIAALSALPETLETKSPHVDEDGPGGQRIYKLAGDRTPAELFKEEIGTENPKASWGEVIAANKYGLGPGSQLDGCGKDWCDRCQEASGGRYTVKNGAPIATVDPETVIDALTADPELSRRSERADESNTSSKVSSNTSQSYTDEYLTRDDIEEALSYINPDLHRDEWRNIGFALADFFDSKSVAKSVFTQWSRGGSKWDDEAPRQADQIIDDESGAADPATIGTVIELARNGGWEMPTPSDTLQSLSASADVDVDDLDSDEAVDRQVWNLWSEKRIDGELSAESRVPQLALKYIARDKNLYDVDQIPDHAEELPPKAHNRALYWLNKTWPEEVDVSTDDNDRATARSYKPRDSGPIFDWEDVRYIYADGDKDGGRLAARRLLTDEHHFMCIEGTDRLQVYDEEMGIYTDELGEIRGQVYDGLGKHWSTHELNEILSGIQQTTTVDARKVNAGTADDPLRCVKNGVLNLLTRELDEHKPEYYFTSRVPVTYDPEADTEPYDEFVDELVEREADAKAMFEMVGHALMPDANERYKKFLILTGDADNGKSQFYKRVKALLNGPQREEKNTASVKLSKIAQNRFSIHALDGRMANIAGEIDGKKLRNTANFKDIIGGDDVEIEPKGQDSEFKTVNTTLMFAANDPPLLGERDKQAIASRIVPIELPFTFVDDPEGAYEKQRVPETELKERLETEEALSGFLNLALDGIERLEENRGDVSLPESPAERLQRYERSADPMREFGERCLENSSSDYVVKADVTAIFKEFAVEQGHEIGQNIEDILHDVLRGLPTLDYTTSRPRQPDYRDTDLPLRGWDSRKRVINRVTLTDEGLQYAEAAGLIDEGSDEAEDEGIGTPLAALDVGRHDLTATVATVSDGEYTREAQGDLKGPHGTYIGFVIPGGNEGALEGLEGERVQIENAKLRTDDDGLRELVVNDATTVTRVGVSDYEGGGDDATAAADGGATNAESDGLESLKPRVVRAVRRLEGDHPEGVPRDEVKDDVDGADEEIAGAIEQALRDGRLVDVGDERLRST